MNYPDLGPEHPANQIPSELLTLADSRFAAKLTAGERCQILALRRIGLSIGAIAVTFGVNRRTVTHICNPDSSRYRSVRNIAEQMGEQAFITKYVTEDLVARVKANHVEDSRPYSEADTAPGIASKGKPNKMANKHDGLHMHRGPGHSYQHRVQVSWISGLDGYEEGWYAKLLDVPNEEERTYWIGDPDGLTHLTSTSALAYARAFLNDNHSDIPNA